MTITTHSIEQAAALSRPDRVADLRELLVRLYGDRSDFSVWFDRLVASISRCVNDRPSPMRALDTIRQSDPNWFTSQQMLAYTAYVDRFGGDLKGVAAKIPHLQALGVTYLHLLPFLKARHGDNDGGFAVSSFEHIEPRLGSMADLSDLARQLRKAGITLCSDIVLNHVADDHEWAVKARAGDPIYSDYFVFVDEVERGQYEAHLREVFPETAPGNFTYVESKRAFVWTTFYAYQWDLNYANPAVFAEMAVILLKLANAGIDAFRFDSVAYLWKQKGTACINLEPAHWIVQALRCIIDVAAPATLLKAEAIMPTQDLPPYLGLYTSQLDSSAPRQREVAECQTAYHSSLMSAMWLAMAEQNTEVLQHVIRNTPNLPASRAWLNYVRCHDDIGWNVLQPELTVCGDPQMTRTAYAGSFFSGEIAGSFARGSKFQVSGSMPNNSTNGMTSALCGLGTDQTGAEQSAADRQLAMRRIVLMYRLAFAFGGIPLIYMGDELGLGNCDSLAAGLSAAEDGRSLHRPVLTDHIFAQRNQVGSNAFELYQQFIRLSTIRASLPALATNQSRRVVECSDVRSTQGGTQRSAQIIKPYLVMQRGQNFVCIANFSGESKTITLSPSDANIDRFIACACTDVETGEMIYLQGYTLEPWQSRWLEIRKD